MTLESGRLPDDTLVIRCGKPPFSGNPLLQACAEHPDGVYGFSVQSAVGVTMAELAAACRNNMVGFTSVVRLREVGLDVIPTSGPMWHATVVVPRDWSEAQAERVSRLFEPISNARAR